MHELSIAMSVIDLAVEQMELHGGKRVVRFTLDIGMLSGVVPEALEFALDEAVRNTVVEGAEQEINYIEAKARCNDCDTAFMTEDYIAVCSSCSSFNTTLLKGKELRLKTIEIE